MLIFNIVIGLLTLLGICLAIPRIRHFILKNFTFLSAQKIKKIIIRPTKEEIKKYGKSVNFKMLILLPIIIFLIILFYVYSKEIFKFIK